MCACTAARQELCEGTGDVTDRLGYSEHTQRKKQLLDSTAVLGPDQVRSLALGIPCNPTSTCFAQLRGLMDAVLYTLGPHSQALLCGPCCWEQAPWSLTAFTGKHF